MYFFFVIAITYDISSDNIPNPNYKCTHHECEWIGYEKDLDWGFFYAYDGTNITGCAPCMAMCDKNTSCTSLECGEDQPMPDGSVKSAYCSYWTGSKCQKPEEFTLNPNNYIVTCKKESIGMLFCSL